MKLYQTLIEQRNEKFDAARVPGTGKRSPRPGYYFIRNTFYETVEPLSQVCMAYVHWKASMNDYFIEDSIFKMAISNLNPEELKDNPGLTPDDFVGKIIRIHSPVFDIKFFNGQPRTVVKCQCYFVNSQPQFLTAQNAALHAYFNNALNGEQAYQNLIDTAPYDVLQALDWEAQYGHIDDAWDAPEHNDDAWDAPDENGDAPDAPVEELKN